MAKLIKSQKDKMIFGVCGGVSEYCGIDSSLIRIIFVLGSIITGSFLLFLYLLLAFILPKE
jgi:phage shock protein PspC (stress-responsive transcriptional regulator)